MNPYRIEVETLKGKWVAVIVYYGKDAKQRAKEKAHILNIVTNATDDGIAWARVRKGES